MPRIFTIVTAALLASWVLSACEAATADGADAGTQFPTADTQFPTADMGGNGPTVIWDTGPETSGPDLWEDEDAEDPSEDIDKEDVPVETDTGTKPPIGAQTPGPCQNPAYVPSPEFCNGVDDDCDGVIDDHAPCADGNPCTMDVCLETSQGCASVYEPMGTPCGAVGYCFEGDCYNDVGCGDGWCEAGENCENCDVDCGVCDACGDTVCSAAETCTTCEADCGDCGLDCTGATCNDGNACTQNDACIAGICQSGAALACSLWPDCKTGFCDPEVGCIYENKPDGTSCGLSMACSLGTCLEDSLESGDIVITEFMANPNQVTDNKGEWFEVYNTTSLPIDINGWELADDKTVHVITSVTPVLVPSNGYAVLAKVGDVSANGGVTSVYAYEKSSDPTNSTFIINNDADGITLKAGWIVIDKVNWDIGSGWPIEPGVALQLDIDKFTTTANDSLFSWCLATSPYGSGDLGTPGSPNGDCP